jgi:hypothetical protein
VYVRRAAFVIDREPSADDARRAISQCEFRPFVPFQDRHEALREANTSKTTATDPMQAIAALQTTHSELMNQLAQPGIDKDRELAITNRLTAITAQITAWLHLLARASAGQRAIAEDDLRELDFADFGLGESRSDGSSETGPQLEPASEALRRRVSAWISCLAQAPYDPVRESADQRPHLDQPTETACVQVLAQASGVRASLTAIADGGQLQLQPATALYYRRALLENVEHTGQKQLVWSIATRAGVSGFVKRLTATSLAMLIVSPDPARLEQFLRDLSLGCHAMGRLLQTPVKLATETDHERVRERLPGRSRTVTSALNCGTASSTHRRTAPRTSCRACRASPAPFGLSPREHACRCDWCLPTHTHARTHAGRFADHSGRVCAKSGRMPSTGGVP